VHRLQGNWTDLRLVLPRVPPGCSMVVAYQWRAGDNSLLREVDALEWWPLSPGLIPRTDDRKGNWIAIAEEWEYYPEPTHERLENGEQYYNRSRRIKLPAQGLGLAPVQRSP
jgi:hypothetical protein